MNLLEQHLSANKNLDIIFIVKSNAVAVAAANYDISWFPELFDILSILCKKHLLLVRWEENNYFHNFWRD